MSEKDWTELKNKIQTYADLIGIDKIGFTDAEPLSEHRSRLERRQKAGYKFGIKEGEPEKRINPRAHLAGARSVISAAVAYARQESGFLDSAAKRGQLSLISRGLDYHQVVTNKLDKLKEFILDEVPDAQIQVMADKEEILEKALAVKAGLGWFGKNTLLITPEFGSWVVLGELVTDIPFPPDQPAGRDCGTCSRCIEACPTGAITEGQDLDMDKCLACVTLMKDVPPNDIREKMGDMLYGCDVCQLACPHNKAAKMSDHPEFAADPEDAYPNLKQILEMTNAGFKSRFGHTSGGWRGRTPFQKNAVIAAGNLKDNDAVPALISILNRDARPVLRSAAAWALGKIGGQQSIRALEASSAAEHDPDVAREIRDSLSKLKEE